MPPGSLPPERHSQALALVVGSCWALVRFSLLAYLPPPPPLFQKYPEHAIYKVLQLMMRRGEIQHRMQRKVLYRIK